MRMQVSLPEFRQEPQEPALGACGGGQAAAIKKTQESRVLLVRQGSWRNWLRSETSDAAGEGVPVLECRESFSPAQRS